VPADSATIGLTDGIFTRVSTRESASHVRARLTQASSPHSGRAQNASAFTIDLQQVSYMLRNCTKRSLLLVDEFGKGTESTGRARL
jgi:DNA mismatch repair protein MSH5